MSLWSLNCVFCNVAEESIFHVLVECSFAHSCWNCSSLGVGVSALELAAGGNSGALEEAVMLCNNRPGQMRQLLDPKGLFPRLEAKTMLRFMRRGMHQLLPYPKAVPQTGFRHNF
uniref:Reverse transcriptase zinc-binding domain-containing protein n=1 Tax=Cannabis sativa TaxID=3483 RepID=A0A803PR97_CANSA